MMTLSEMEIRSSRRWDRVGLWGVKERDIGSPELM